MEQDIMHYHSRPFSIAISCGIVASVCLTGHCLTIMVTIGSCNGAASVFSNSSSETIYVSESAKVHNSGVFVRSSLSLVITFVTFFYVVAYYVCFRVSLMIYIVYETQPR